MSPQVPHRAPSALFITRRRSGGLLGMWTLSRLMPGNERTGVTSYWLGVAPVPFRGETSVD
jgi:hypothetical protein